MKQKFRFFVLLTLFAVFIGTGLSGRSPVAKIDSISGKEVIVTGGNIGRNLPMGSKVYVVVDDKVIVMNVNFPMQNMAKCTVIKGNIRNLKKGMAVHKGDGSDYVKAETIADTGTPGEITTIGGIEFVYIPAGSFMMGSPESEVDRDDDEKQHKVTLTKGFWMGKYEVTQKRYEEIMGTNQSNFSGKPDNPVETVSWNDAMEFCRKFSEKYGVKATLPTEAQWEYAARAGTTTKYYWGDSMNGGYAWYDGNSNSSTQPVGRKRPNAFGLYDMSGNVWEWCSDWYDAEYYKSSPERDPLCTNNASGSRVLRGGSWSCNAHVLRSALRSWALPGSSSSFSGFRVVVVGSR